MVDLTQFKKRDIKAIRQGDEGFMINDGLIMYPRAMLHVVPECPPEYRQLILDCVNRGWLKTVAHVQGKELSWEKLTA